MKTSLCVCVQPKATPAIHTVLTVTFKETDTISDINENKKALSRVHYKYVIDLAIVVKLSQL
jgi:hypothetical protein